MQIPEQTGYSNPYPDIGRISSPAITIPVSPASGTIPKGADKGAYSVEISQQAREMSALAKEDGQAKITPSLAAPAAPQSSDARKAGKSGAIECQTCKNREYRDVSNDSSVSFQTATRIDPAAAESMVRAHEQEHVSHEQLRAKESGGEVVSQSVSIHYQTCPECGKSYVAGGTTTTTTRSGADKVRAAGNGAAGDQSRKSISVRV
jgi:hypothetical protein